MKKIIGVVAAIVIGFTGQSLASGPVKWNQAGGEKDEAMHLIGNPADGLDVFEVCSACHMPEGWGTKDGTFPQIAGQHKNVILKQLADIRALNRDNPTMYPFALPSSIGDAQALADVAEYMYKLPMNPANGRGEWAEGTPEFKQGEKLFADNCTECHSKTGYG
ncbi:MAG: c-type cytochrome, partial [Gammaproteobacteria bacterium]|nr:c-type cytochrome [Gammaproteobacteria bacterium]